MAAMREPIAPTPTIPSVLPASSVEPSASARLAAHPAARSVPSMRCRRRASRPKQASACSATASRLEPGTLATGMPRALAAATGIMSTPTPWRTTPRSLGAWSNRSAGSGERTTSTSAPATSRRSVSGRASGACTTSATAAIARSPSGCIAPVSRTCGRRIAVARSLRRDAGVADHLRPLGRLVLQMRGELLRRAADDVDALGGELLLDVGQS